MGDDTESDIKTQQDRATAHSTDDRELVEKLLSNPETLALLKSLAKAL